MGSLPKIKYFSIQEAANYLGVSTKTLRRWEQAKRLAPVRTKGGHRRYVLSDLSQITEKKKIKSHKVYIKKVQPIKPYNYSLFTPQPEKIQLYKSFELHSDQKKVIKFLAYSFFSFLFLVFVYKTAGSRNIRITNYLPLPPIARAILDSRLVYSPQIPQTSEASKVLAAETSASLPTFNVNIISSFKDVADFVKGLTASDVSTSTLEASGSATFGDITNIKGVNYTFPTTQGAASTVLRNNGTGTLSWGTLTVPTALTDLTGVLPISQGGTNNSNSYSSGSVIFSDGTKLSQNNANFFWDDSNKRLGINTNSPGASLSVGSSSQFQVDSTGNVTKIDGVTYSFPSSQGAASTILTNDGGGTLTWAAASSVSGITGTGTTNTIPKFTSSSVVGNSLLTDSGSTLAYNGNFSVTSGGGISGITSVGLTLGSDATGDIYYRNNSGNLTRLGVGGSGQTLTVSAGLPSWVGGSGTGSSGFWDRTGTTLSPTNTGDAITTSGSISTSGSGTVTSAGLLTGSNGLTLTTGALNLTSTSGTSNLTSTATSGDSFAFTNSSLSAASANLANYTVKNNNTGAGITVNGVNISGTGATPSGGTNTTNLIQISATALGSNTFNGINFGSGLTNYINNSSWVVTAAGAETLSSSLTSVGVNSQSGLIQGTGGITVTGTAQINATGTANTTIGNSSGTFALISTGLNVSAGALTGVSTLDTISTSATALTFAGAGTLDSTGANNLNLGTGGTAKTINIGTGVTGNTVNIGASSSTTVTFAGIATGTGNALCLSGTTLVTCTVGSGGVSGSGTTGRLTKFTTSSAIGDSLLSESGTTLSLNTATAVSGTSVTALDLGAAIFTFNGAGTIKTTTTNALTLDTGTTGTINLGTGTSGKTINIGTDNTNADTINIASALDTTTIAGILKINLGSDATGDTYYRNSSGNFIRLGIGSAGQTLTVSGGVPVWVGGTGTGTEGFWTRTGTTLSPFNSGDAITTSGNVSTTGSGAITAAGLLTASNGFTLTTGALNLTATSGSIAAAGFGTSSITSTTATGNINTLADSSLAIASGNTGNLLNLTFTNGSTNTSGTSTTTGINIAPTNNAAGSGGVMNNYGIKIADIAGILGAGTQNNYGIRIGNQGQTPTGTATSYGLYVDSQTGASTNYAAIFAGGNVGISNLTPTRTLDVTGTGAFSSTLTASNGFTLTTGALNLTSTSGTSNLTSTAASGDSFAFTNTSLNTASANLASLTVKNNNTAGAGLTVNGANISATGSAPLSGTNTTNLINLGATALASNTFNGINFGSGLSNYVNATNWIVTASGAETLASDLAVNGSNLTTSNTGTFALLNTNATTINFGGAATTALNIGAGNSAYTAINIGTGTGGNVINLATNDTAADTLNLGSLKDTLAIKGTSITTTLSTTNSALFSSSTTNSDSIAIKPQSGTATNSFTGTITSADLTVARTWTLPDADGTICVSGQACATTGTVTSTGTSLANRVAYFTGDTVITGNAIYTFNPGATTQTTTSSNLSLADTTLTSGTNLYLNSNHITTGKLLDVADSSNTWTGNGTTNGLINFVSSSTAGANNNILLNLARSGTNGTSAVTSYGLYSNITNAGTTSTNVAGFFSATGGTTADYGVQTGSLTAPSSGTAYGIDVGTSAGASSATFGGERIGAISGAGTQSWGITIGANTSTATTNTGIDIGAISGAGTTNLGINIGNLSGGTTSKGIAIGTNSSATATGIDIGNFTGNTSTGLKIGTLAGTTADTGVQVGNISAGTGTNNGISLGTLTGGTGSSGNQISTGAITGIASGTWTGINLGGISGPGTETDGIKLGANTATATTNYGINIGAISGAGTTNTAINIGAVSAAGTNNYIVAPNFSVTAAGLTGIGQAAGSGSFLSLAAGTSTLAQINFASSTDKSSPATGDIWWNGTNLNFRKSGSTVDLLSSSGGVTTTGSPAINQVTYFSAAGTITGDSTYLFKPGAITGTTTSSNLSLADTTLTSGTNAYLSSNHITTGKLLDVATSGNTWTGNGTTNGLINLASTSTAGTASATNILLNLTRSGANSNSAVTSYGVYSAVTNTGTTSVNGGGFFNATGAVTNYNLDLGAISTANTTNAAINVGSISGATNNYGIFFNNAPTTGSINTAAATNLNINTGTTGVIGIDSGTTGAINIGTGANAKTITLGNVTGATALTFNSGTGTQSFNSTVATTTGTSGAFAFTANSLTTGTGAYFNSSSITTGDLVLINATGTTLTTGNLFNVQNNSSSVFSVGASQITNALPTAFTAAGDVSIAYDIQFTNPTSSSIKSSAPLLVASGEVFNSSNLTLRTYNAGNILLDTGTSTTAQVTGKVGIGPSVSPISLLHVSNTNESTTIGKALAIFDQAESQDILTASQSGVTKFTLKNLSTNFGAIADTGAFIANTSSMAQEFNSDIQTSASTADSAAVGDDGHWYVDLSTAASTESWLQGNNTNGFARMTLGATTSRGTLLGFGEAQNVLNAIYLKANLPVVQMKIKTSLNANTDDVIWGLMDQATAITSNDPLPANGIFFSSNNGTSWVGVVRSSSANVGTVTCPGTISTSQFATGRINVISTSSVDFWIDNDASDGVNMIYCGNVSGANPTAALAPVVNASHTDTNSWNVDVDYVRTWQDDSTSSLAVANPTNNSNSVAATNSTETPIPDASASAQITDFNVFKDVFTATDSGVVAKVHELDTTKLSVLGDTVLADTVINGKLNVGSLTFDNTNQSINAIGTLKIQDLALGNIEFMNGLITFDTNGNIIAKSVTADKYKVAGASAGVGTITSGKTSTIINTNQVGNGSLIFVTAQTATTKTLAVTAKTTGTSFKVEIPSADTKDIQFNWWIVDKN